MMIIIFWEMTPCGSYKKMEAIRSSETSVLIRATRRYLPEDDNHHTISNRIFYMLSLHVTENERFEAFLAAVCNEVSGNQTYI
jgi:hypothetical protein